MARNRGKRKRVTPRRLEMKNASTSRDSDIFTLRAADATSTRDLRSGSKTYFSPPPLTPQLCLRTGSVWMPRRRRTLGEHHGDVEGSSHKQPLRLVARTNILHRCASQKHGFHM
ncbi:hypothetical protein PC128_g15556 [Phytophthora cactorum]|nr:hypothetical protein PC128_g15556 [Phytophthora cactorum]